MRLRPSSGIPCPAPGCTRHLLAGTASGVCQKHLHGPSCLCKKCKDKPPRLPYTPPMKDAEPEWLGMDKLRGIRLQRN